MLISKRYPEITPEITLETILELPLEVNMIAALMALSGLLLLVLSFSRLRQRQLISAGIYSSLSSGLLVIAIALIALSMNLHTYRRLSHEQDIAEIVFHQIAPRQYSATIYFEDDNQVAEYILMGEEWQLDARIIKWDIPMNLAGLDSLYRLERISGRYRDIEEERTANRTVYSLAENKGLDIWSITKRYPSWLPWIDAYYGTATYLPMNDKARFKITLSQTGLLARPANEPGKQALRFWD
ncbi:MAG: cation/multidrug efflux pump [Proteobacteria bacterium]|nr:cation/multidrug efflux pump [Pseudomonadota bacterium]